MDDTNYKPSEEDVLAVLGYLRTNLPEQATPENAILLLRHWDGYYSSLEQMYPEEIEKILKDFEDRT